MARWFRSRWRERTHRREFLTAVALVWALAHAGPTLADSDRLHHPLPPAEPRVAECDPKAVRPKPCHIHDPRTIDKIAPHAPVLRDPHARKEYDAWRSGRIPEMY